MPHVFEDFARVAERFPDKVAVEFCRRADVERCTYAELSALAHQVAGVLAGAGITKGARCAILADNDARWCGAYFGILRLGAIAVPLDTAYHAPQVRTVLADSGATVLVTSARHLATAREATAAMSPAPEVLLLSGTAPGVRDIDTALGAGVASSLPPCPATSSDAAVMLYTSGTTSDPKGVVLTHGNLLAEKTAAFTVVRLTEHDAILGVLPLFHALAQLANLLLPFTAGARVVFLETITSTDMMRAFTERQITTFCVVPQFYYLLHQRIMDRVASSPFPARVAFRSLLAANARLRQHLGLNLGRRLFKRAHDALGGHMRVMVSGGSRFDSRIGRDLYAMGFNILQAYGLTECSGAATLLRPGDPHVEAVGQVLAGVEIRILPDPASPLDREHPDGEVLIKGPIVMAGYHNRPDVNAAALEDGWLHTGDLGYLDEDGRLYITGRKREIIVLASGKNIYPEEIEAHYAQSPFIRELCVMGVALSGEPSAERLHAIVVPNVDLMRERHIVNFREVIRFDIEGLALGLPHYKRVLSFDIWLEDLPRTTTRKLKRHEIERRYRDGQTAAEERPAGADWSDADQVWAADPRVSRILAAIRTSAHGAAVTPDANLELDLGLDSMERVELFSRLEQEMGVDVAEEAAQRIYTVRDLVDAVHPLTGESGAQASAAVADPWARTLAADESDEVFASILKPRPIFGTFAFLVMRALHACARVFAGLRVTGREHIPAAGPFVLSPNHQSYLDGFLLVGALPYATFRRLFFVGASEYFETPLRRTLAEWINVVPVDPDANLLRAMQAGAFGLRRNRVLALFPEGERSPDGAPRRFKKGAAITALQAGVPIVPVAIHGVFEIWPRGKSLQWRTLWPWAGTRCDVQFGPPIPSDGAALAAGSDKYEQHTAALRASVVQMWDALESQRRRL